MSTTELAECYNGTCKFPLHIIKQYDKWILLLYIMKPFIKTQHIRKQFNKIVKKQNGEFLHIKKLQVRV